MRKTICMCLAGILPALSAASANPTIQAVKVTAPPVIDGDLSDSVWGKAPRAESFTDIAAGTLAPDQTIVRIVYDEKNIYVGFECKDSQPDKIVGRETVRDSKYQNQGQNGPSDVEDNVEVQLDAFSTHKREELSRFSVNAIGTVSAALAGGRGNKAEWKGEFIAAVRRSATGWTAEMRIPWASLNYPSQAQVSMGINFQRYQTRTNILSIWSNVGPQGMLDKEGIWTGVEVPRSAFHPTLSLLPYVLGALGPVGESARFGLDARYTVTPGLTAVASVKPDFSTVEGAIQGIQFSRTERFVPDLRPFFLEGQNYFSVQTKYNDIGAFFYPNRISTFDIGSKVYGKISPADTLGFLNTYGFDGRNDMVTRYTHNFGPTTNGGFFVSERTLAGDHNRVIAGDFHTRWGKLSTENITASTSGTFAGGGAMIQNLTYEDKLLIGQLSYQDISTNFNDEDGFVPTTGNKGFTGVGVWYNNWQHGPWRDFQVLAVPNYWWHTDGRVFQRGVDLPLSIETRSDLRVTAEYNYFRYDDQTDNTVTLGILNGATNRFRQYGLNFQFGILGNQPAAFITPQISLRMFKKLDLTYAGSILNLAGVTQQHILTANYEISPTRSFGGRLVTQDSATNWFLYYHNSGGKGTEMYVLIGDPNAPRFVRKLEVKFVFAVSPRLG